VYSNSIPGSGRCVDQVVERGCVGGSGFVLECAPF
jgi:hypothetical protein